MIAFILAGGFATRLWPLTEKRAKPLLPLAGKPILDHIIDRIPQDMNIIVSTNDAFAADFEAWKSTAGSSARPIDIRIERTKNDDEKLGALGAFAQWISDEHINDDVLLLTGDNYIGFNLNTFIDQYENGTPLVAAYDIGDMSNASAFGTVILDSDGKTVDGFEEKPKEPKSSLVSTGCSIIPKEHLKTLVDYAAHHPDNVGGIFEEFLSRDIPVHCFTFTEPWFDIGSFETYLEATRILVGSNVQSGEESHIDESVTEGSVVIGARSSVRKSRLRDVVLFEDCSIDDCVLEDCIIDNGCVLRGIDLRGKMLRAGTHLMR